MKFRARSLVCVTASLLAVLGVLQLSALPASASTAGTRVSALQRIGWYGYSGSNVYQDALAQVLEEKGAVAGRQFLAAQRKNMLDATYRNLRNLLAQLESPIASSPDARAELVLGHPTGVTAPSATASITSLPLTPAIDVGRAVSEPVQATHGDPKAIAYYTWYLHGNDGFTRIYYGDCNSGCETDGYFNAFEQSNLNFQPEAFWQTEIREGAGQHASFSQHKVRMMRDISGGGDSTVLTLGCSTSGTNALDCTAYPNTPTILANWYYYREDVTVQYPEASAKVQIQTRRWKNNGQTIDFPAYYFGG